MMDVLTGIESEILIKEEVAYIPWSIREFLKEKGDAWHEVTTAGCSLSIAVIKNPY